MFLLFLTLMMVVGVIALNWCAYNIGRLRMKLEVLNKVVGPTLDHLKSFKFDNDNAEVTIAAREAANNIYESFTRRFYKLK